MKKGFPTVVAAARCGNPLLSAAELCVSLDGGRHPAATNRVARHSMSEDRAASGGVHFASKTNTQMSSGNGLKRLYYKAFAEAKLPASSLLHERNYAD